MNTFPNTFPNNFVNPTFGWNAPGFGQNWFGNNWGGFGFPQFGGQPWNTQTMNCVDGSCGFNSMFGGWNTPNFINSTFPFGSNWNTGWNWGNTPVQQPTPFPGLYNFSNGFFGPFNSNVAGSYGNAPFVNNWTPSFGVPSFNTPWHVGPWNGYAPSFGFGFNTPIYWGQPGKVEGETIGKKGEAHVGQNRVAAYPVGFGPFVPFGYTNGEFAKGASACAA